MKPYYKTELTTIYNGDCLDVMDYLIEQGVKVDAIITDPPYGTTACSWDSVIPFDEMWERLKKLRKDKTPVLLFGSEPFSSHLRLSNISEYKYDWIWEKETSTNGMNANKMPLFNYEVISIFYKNLPIYNPIFTKGTPYRIKRNKPKKDSVYGKTGTKDDFKTKNDGVRYPTRIIYFNTERGLHPTQKPKDLIQYLIRTYTNKDDLILDFTSGSFTTCVAVEQLKRRSIGIEISKEYCDIGIKRLNNLQIKFDI